MRLGFGEAKWEHEMVVWVVIIKSKDCRKST